MMNSIYTSNLSYKLITRTVTDKDRKEYFKWAIQRLREAKQKEWDSNIIEFKNGSCRVNYLANKNIWYSIRLASNIDDIGIEIKLVMTNALRLSLIDMQHIIDTAHNIANVCESRCTIYKA